jgi:AcrR family transcriptional regulator
VGSAERREREREELRTRIVEAARDLLSENGLAGLSMRAIAERIEYSPATIYLHFRDKEELIREVVAAGFGRLDEYMRAAVADMGPGADALARYASTGRAYARFALENTAYFRVMFELPSVAQMMDCGESRLAERGGEAGEHCFEYVVSVVAEAAEQGELRTKDPLRTAVIGWGLVHGLTSLHLSGHLAQLVTTPEEFEALVEEAIETFGGGRKATVTSGGGARA